MRRRLVDLLIRSVFIAAALIAASVPRPAPAQSGWLPTSWFTAGDVDPQAMYPLAEKDGPWLVLATTFRGEGARDDARKLVATGEAPVPADLPAPELASWTMISNAVLASDAAIVKD